MHDMIIRGGTIVDGTGDAPYQADIAVDGNNITAIGDIAGPARTVIDASGRIVTPGFVDIHTHYDGQATWDDEMAPSSWHGVTTVVMGNFGVGYAPAKPDKHDWLIGLMEGVEDIPGTALAEGMTWNWETFPEYLDALDQMPRTIDIATHVPHGAIRAYVLGDRECPGAVPTADDIKKMSAIVEEGLRAGALGFSTSRTILHRSIDGELVPGTTATKEELIGIGRAMGRVGHGVFEMASDLKYEWDEFGWMGDLSRETGLPVTFAALQSIAKEMPLDEQIAATAEQNAKGANIVAQIALRGNGVIMAWRGTLHPFMFKPSWEAIKEQPWEDQYKQLQNPEFKAQLIAEPSIYPDDAGDLLPLLMVIANGWMVQYEMGDGFNYEPTAEQSLAARAEKAGITAAEYAYDMMMQNEGKGMIYYPILNYADGNLDFLHPLFHREDTVNSLSDGGAHCGTICDAAATTFFLEYWVKNRNGARIDLAHAIKRQTADTAQLYGLNDRGLLKPGYLADINIINLESIGLNKPWLAFDLPAGGKRLLQTANGYDFTIKSGQITFENGNVTKARPGGLIRGPQSMAARMAAE